jgi:acyl carrier protein
MIALSIIAMIDDEYGITIKGSDIKFARTIEDLYNIANGYKQK